VVWGFETLAHHEDFSRLTTGRRGLRRLYLVEELVTDEKKSIVIFRSEDLSDESTTLAEDFSGQSESV